MPQKSLAILKDSEPWFNLGCQGPDIFYHNMRTKPLAISYGSLVHRRGWESMGKALLGVDTHGLDERQARAWEAFVLGWLTHGPVDRVAHPFIVYRSGWQVPGKPETGRYLGNHPFYERVLDVFLWEHQTASGIENFDQEKALVPPDDFSEDFARLLAQALQKAYPSRAMNDDALETRMYNSFQDSWNVYRFSAPKSTRVSSSWGNAFIQSLMQRGVRALRLIYPENFERDTDWANESNSEWMEPCMPERKSRKSFFTLMDEAVHNATADLAALAMGEYGKRIHSSYDGTLNVGDENGRQAKPVFMEPLPLRETMEAQLKLRLEFTVDRPPA